MEGSRGAHVFIWNVHFRQGLYDEYAGVMRG